MCKAGLTVTILLTSICVNLPLAKAGEIVFSEWTSPTLSNLFSVYMVNTTDGWAVGESGTTIHWDGTQWTNVTSPTTYVLYSISMVNSNDGWAVGELGTIIRWDGVRWVLEYTETVYAVFLLSLTLITVILIQTEKTWDFKAKRKKAGNF